MGSCSSHTNPDEVDLSWFRTIKQVGKGGFGKVRQVKIKRGALTGKNLAIKQINKLQIVRKKLTDMVWAERDVMVTLSKLNSKFLVNLLFAFQDQQSLYFVTDFMEGGDLRWQLTHIHGAMDVDMVRFYASQLVLALEALHSRNIVYRDLKPENCLVDSRGYLRLSDFGLACQLDATKKYKTQGRCGTWGYQAPEMLTMKEYGLEVDFYSFGVLLYEMLHGKLFWDNNPGDQSSMFSTTVQSRSDTRDLDLEMSHKMRMSSDLVAEVPDAVNLITGLLQVKVAKRLGYRGSWFEVKEHPFFQGVDWDNLANMEQEPPHRCRPQQGRNFETREEIAAAFKLDDDNDDGVLTLEEDEVFEGFEFHTDPKYALESPMLRPRKRKGSNARSSQLLSVCAT